ncbi:biotin carboxylase [Oxalobacteraceae bacterium GrIS 1.11]
MKTAIIISTRGFGVFHFDLLKWPERTHFIGVFAEPDAANVLPEQKPHFHAIHLIPCAIINPSPMLMSLVDYDASYAIIAKVLESVALADLSIHCYDEQNMLVAARLRSAFGTRGPSYDDILPYRDKLLMKEKLLARQIRVPHFGRFLPGKFAADAGAYFACIKDAVGLPFIMKPVDSAGADGVYKINSFSDFSALPDDLMRAYEYEEFIDGTMYSVNIVSQNGRTVFGGVTEYLVNSFDIQSGKVNADVNLIDHDPRVARMVGFAEQALDALGWLDGGSHLELFLTAQNEIVFLEVAARFKGLAGLAAMERNYGIAFINLAFEIEAGIESHPYNQEQTFCFDGVIPLKTGQIDELHEPKIESAVKINWKVASTDCVRQTESLISNAGTFLVWNDDYDALYRDFKALAHYEPISYALEAFAA